MRVAAVGDIHVGVEPGSAERLHRGWAHLARQADVLLLAGDLTRCGEPAEAEIVAEAVSRSGVPTFAVLGNHDHHSDQPGAVVAVLEAAGATVLDGEGVVLETPAGRIGVAGVKGFGGGFEGATISEFGEPEMKAFARHIADVAARLRSAQSDLAEADVRVALLHYAPVRDTLQGEPPELYPFLGSYLLAEAIDAAGADLVVHGHAHRGSERGMTRGGVRVRNVAQPVIRSAYRLFDLAPSVRRDQPGPR